MAVGLSEKEEKKKKEKKKKKMAADKPYPCKLYTNAGVNTAGYRNNRSKIQSVSNTVCVD